MTLEQCVAQLEKEVAELKVQVSAQQNVSLGESISTESLSITVEGLDELVDAIKQLSEQPKVINNYSQVSARPESKSFVEQYPQVDQFLNAYLECLTSVAEDIKNSVHVDKDTLFALHDGVRIIHHIKKIVNEG